MTADHNENHLVESRDLRVQVVDEMVAECAGRPTRCCEGDRPPWPAALARLPIESDRDVLYSRRQPWDARALVNGVLEVPRRSGNRTAGARHLGEGRPGRIGRRRV